VKSEKSYSFAALTPSIPRQSPTSPLGLERLRKAYTGFPHKKLPPQKGLPQKGLPQKTKQYAKIYL
jgi:hypothetical protein